MNSEIPAEVQTAWEKYQATVRTLEARRRDVFAREDTKNTTDSLAQLRSKLGLA